jgi:hypothetical protein
MGEIPIAEREEMLQEIRSHIVDRVQAEGEVTEYHFNRILGSVGDPRQLASQYKTEAILGYDRDCRGNRSFNFCVRLRGGGNMRSVFAAQASLSITGRPLAESATYSDAWLLERPNCRDRNIRLCLQTSLQYCSGHANVYERTGSRNSRTLGLRRKPLRRTTSFDRHYLFHSMVHSASRAAKVALLDC